MDPAGIETGRSIEKPSTQQLRAFEKQALISKNKKVVYFQLFKETEQLRFMATSRPSKQKTWGIGTRCLHIDQIPSTPVPHFLRALIIAYYCQI